MAAQKPTDGGRGQRWVGINEEAIKRYEKLLGDIHTHPSFQTSSFPHDDEWSDDNLPEILFYVFLPNIQKRSRKELPPLLDEMGEPMYRANGKPVLDFDILPKKIALDAPAWLIETWRRLDPRISYNDILDRQTPDSEWSFRKLKANALQNHCRRKCRDLLGAWLEYGRREEPHKVDVKNLEKLSYDKIVLNTFLSISPDNPSRLAKVKFCHDVDARGRFKNFRIEPLKVTKENMHRTSYPLDYFRSHQPEFDPTKEDPMTSIMHAAFQMCLILQERASLHGITDWAKLPKACLPASWFDRTKTVIQEARGADTETSIDEDEDGDDDPPSDDEGEDAETIDENEAETHEVQGNAVSNVQPPENDTYDGGCEICTWRPAIASHVDASDAGKAQDYFSTSDNSLNRATNPTKPEISASPGEPSEGKSSKRKRKSAKALASKSASASSSGPSKRARTRVKAVPVHSSTDLEVLNGISEDEDEDRNPTEAQDDPDDDLDVEIKMEYEIYRDIPLPPWYRQDSDPGFLSGSINEAAAEEMKDDNSISDGPLHEDQHQDQPVGPVICQSTELQGYISTAQPRNLFDIMLNSCQTPIKQLDLSLNGLPGQDIFLSQQFSGQSAYQTSPVEYDSFNTQVGEAHSRTADTADDGNAFLTPNRNVWRQQWFSSPGPQPFSNQQRAAAQACPATAPQPVATLSFPWLYDTNYQYPGSAASAINGQPGLPSPASLSEGAQPSYVPFYPNQQDQVTFQSSISEDAVGLSCDFDLPTQAVYRFNGYLSPATGFGASDGLTSESDPFPSSPLENTRGNFSGFGDYHVLEKGQINDLASFTYGQQGAQNVFGNANLPNNHNSMNGFITGNTSTHFIPSRLDNTYLTEPSSDNFDDMDMNCPGDKMDISNSSAL